MSELFINPINGYLGLYDKPPEDWSCLCNSNSIVVSSLSDFTPTKELPFSDVDMTVPDDFEDDW